MNLPYKRNPMAPKDWVPHLLSKRQCYMFYFTFFLDLCGKVKSPLLRILVCVKKLKVYFLES